MEPFVALFLATVMLLKTLSCWMRSPGILLSPQSADHCDHTVSQFVQHFFDTFNVYFLKKTCPDSWVCIFGIIYIRKNTTFDSANTSKLLLMLMMTFHNLQNNCWWKLKTKWSQKVRGVKKSMCAGLTVRVHKRLAIYQMNFFRGGQYCLKWPADRWKSMKAKGLVGKVRIYNKLPVAHS